MNSPRIVGRKAYQILRRRRWEYLSRAPPGKPAEAIAFPFEIILYQHGLKSDHMMMAMSSEAYWRDDYPYEWD